MPETKQRTLEVISFTLTVPIWFLSIIRVQELDYVFAVPTHKHVHYQVTKFLPYWIKRWILLQKDAKLESLYDFEQVESITVFEKGAGH